MRGNPPESQDQVERKIASLKGSGFSPRQLRRACHAVLSESLPLRDAIVLRKAKEFAEQQTPRAKEGWRDVLSCLRDSVRPTTYRNWLEPLVLVGEDQGALVLEAPEGIRAWAERRYSHLIREALADCSDFTRVVFVSSGGES